MSRTIFTKEGHYGILVTMPITGKEVLVQTQEVAKRLDDWAVWVKYEQARRLERRKLEADIRQQRERYK